jgi:UDP-glucose 4-epimerase
VKYLVTGGCGFIGSHLVDALHERGHYIRILDDLSTGSLRYIPEGVEHIRGDVTNPEIVAEALSGMDGCFHLAQVASVEQGNLDWLGAHRTNLTGTVTIFDSVRKLAPPIPVVFASSAAVYGNAGVDFPLSEDYTTKPLSAHGVDMLGCELYGVVAATIHRVPNCALRLFNVYGPRQDDPPSPFSGVITIFSNRMREGQPITINGDGEQVRDFIYVTDVVSALMAAMERCARSGPTHRVFNVCTGVKTRILSLANHIGILLDRKPEIIFGLPRPGDPHVSFGDPTKATRTLNFYAATGLESGLEKTLGL